MRDTLQWLKKWLVIIWTMISTERYVEATPFCESIQKIHDLLMGKHLKLDGQHLGVFYLRDFRALADLAITYDDLFIYNRLEEQPYAHKRTLLLSDYAHQKVLDMPDAHIRALLYGFLPILEHARDLHREVKLYKIDDRDKSLTLKFSVHVLLDIMTIIDSIVEEKR